MADEQTGSGSTEGTPAHKPGYKTTEFWITVFVTACGLAMASGLIPAGSAWDKAIGLAMGTLATMGYSASRGNVKSS